MLADRWGRANLVTYGLAVTGVLALITPLAPNKFVFGIFAVLGGVVEGMCLVATPALVRDFSPQIGRASAMGFWTLGPVVGSLIVSFVANRTLPHLDNSWSSQFYIVGVVGLIAFAIALFGLRELKSGPARPGDGQRHATARSSSRAPVTDASRRTSNGRGGRCCTSTSSLRRSASASSC